MTSKNAFRPNCLLFVIKLSKYCNLRCSYCYEFSELSNKSKISLSKLENIFIHINEFARGHGIKDVFFVWHGGEPFLIPISYYLDIGTLQKNTFHKSITIHNGTQSNATICSEEHIKFLKDGTFFNDGIGVSFDVYGNSRVDKKNAPVTPLVLSNIQKYIDSGLQIGAITVLERSTLEKLSNILDFYDSINTSVRFLPFYKSDNSQQAHKHGVSGQELTTALITLFNHWLKSNNAVRVSPLDSYIEFALNFTRNEKKKYYDRTADENIFIVNTDGLLWSDADAYDMKLVCGDLSSQPLHRLLASDNRKTSLLRSQSLLNMHCKNCDLYGFCPGEYVSNATKERIKMLDSSGCPIASVIRHIADVLPTIPDLNLENTELSNAAQMVVS